MPSHCLKTRLVVCILRLIVGFFNYEQASGRYLWSRVEFYDPEKALAASRVMIAQEARQALNQPSVSILTRRSLSPSALLRNQTRRDPACVSVNSICSFARRDAAPG